jgi:pimeloyl-ACP methyl ester carboxylesterase
MRRNRELSGAQSTWLFVLLTLCSVNASAQGAPSREQAGSVLSTCQLPGVSETARCGVIHLPENPALPSGRKLPIHVAVLAATSGRSLPDPIVILRGGPGEDTISAAADIATQFGSLRQERDVLLIDQRGTGKSGALPCPLYSSDEPAANLRHAFPPAAVERCVSRLRAQADLTQYTFARFADDLENVRRVLGYGALNLFAGSYGTRAAQVYVRAYPQSVRTIYFGSIVPIDLAMPLPMARAAQAAIEQVFEACAADSVCAHAFPNLRAEFRAVERRLATGTVRVALEKQAEPVVLERGRVAEWFRSRLYRPEGASQLPWLIHRAYEGDYQPIADGIVQGAIASDAGLSFGLFFAITCNEDVRFVHEHDIAKHTSGTFLRDYRIRQQQAACKLFPRVPLAEGYRAPVRSNVPAMFVSGDFDAGTPLWFTGHAAPGFSKRVQIVLRGRGHTDWNDCIAALYRTFVTTGSVEGLDPTSCPAVAWPAFKTE